MMSFDGNKPRAEDVSLLAQLGLPVWHAALRQETLIGEVRPYEAEQQPGEVTRILIYVTCCPAQFFRFVIERKSEDEGYDGMECVEVGTGSGSGTLSGYWPMALAIAEHRLTVSEVVRLNA